MTVTIESTDDRKRSCRRGGIAWTVVLTVCLLAAYFVIYISTARERFVPEGVVTIGRFKSRIYHSPALAKFFFPAAWLEAKLTHTEIQIVGLDLRKDNFRNNQTFNCTIEP